MPNPDPQYLTLMNAGLTVTGDATNVSDRTTVWTFENRIGEAGAQTS